MQSHFLLLLSKFFVFWQFFYYASKCESYWVNPKSSLNFLDVQTNVFHHFLAIISLNILSAYLTSLLFLRLQLYLCWFTWQFLQVCEIQFIFFILFHFDSSGWIISIELSSRYLIHLPVEICCWVHLVNFSFQ